MAPLPGVTVTSQSISGVGAGGGQLGTWFIAGLTELGPLAPVHSRPIRSLADFVKVYGARVSYSTLYDAVDAFFRSGGSRIFVARVAGPAATFSSLALADRAGTPVATLLVKPKGPGAYGTRISVAAENGAVSNTYRLKIYFDGQIVEQSGDLTTPADAVDWASTVSRLVGITNSGSATAAPGNIPAVAAAAALTGGSDDRASITDTQWAAALATFTQNLGPGLVSMPGRSTAAAHTQQIVHASLSNRQAFLDGADQANQAALSALAISDRSSGTADEYGALFAPWIKIPGLISGTTRSVPPSAVAAGIVSRQVSGGPANVPAAGQNGEIPWVISLANPFTDAERGQLADDGVNTFHKAYGAGSISLYGYRTLDTNGGWPLLNNQLLRLKVSDQGALIGEQYLFDQLDGRGHTIAQFAADLSAMLQGHWEADELYGETAAAAYRVDVGAAVNTSESISAGQLRALLSVRMSPFAEQVQILLTKYPPTETLTTA